MSLESNGHDLLADIPSDFLLPCWQLPFFLDEKKILFSRQSTSHVMTRAGQESNYVTFEITFPSLFATLSWRAALVEVPLFLRLPAQPAWRPLETPPALCKDNPSAKTAFDQASKASKQSIPSSGRPCRVESALLKVQSCRERTGA